MLYPVIQRAEKIWEKTNWRKNIWIELTGLNFINYEYILRYTGQSGSLRCKTQVLMYI